MAERNNVPDNIHKSFSGFPMMPYNKKILKASVTSRSRRHSRPRRILLKSISSLIYNAYFTLMIIKKPADGNQPHISYPIIHLTSKLVCSTSARGEIINLNRNIRSPRGTALAGFRRCLASRVASLASRALLRRFVLRSHLFIL